MNELSVLQAKTADMIERMRGAVAENAAEMLNEYQEKVRADGSPKAYKDYFELVNKIMPGVAVVEKKDPDANLQIWNITIDGGISTELVQPVRRAVAAAQQIEDAKILGADDAPKPPSQVAPTDPTEIVADILEALDADSPELDILDEDRT